MKYGYARISTNKQKTDRQVEELQKYNLQKIYTDTITGSKFDRPNYKKLVEEILRSEERRVGKECRSRWSPYH